ncbi:hypothetical protein RRG08_033649 [Elysia crispata]|uniref:Uncharacterized protein n=1 Tax=Elysia crispata TaxID=231223 RepID=A0AAE1B742_9GAST|nr:hypothetical protein RRG08_033649 [Elysia crispata]
MPRTANYSRVKGSAVKTTSTRRRLKLRPMAIDIHLSKGIKKAYQSVENVRRGMNSKSRHSKQKFLSAFKVFKSAVSTGSELAPNHGLPAIVSAVDKDSLRVRKPGLRLPGTQTGSVERIQERDRARGPMHDSTGNEKEERKTRQRVFTCRQVQLAQTERYLVSESKTALDGFLVFHLFFFKDGVFMS